MKRILIIKMSALGDIMIALPHIEAICRHHAEDQVCLLTGPDHAPLFADHPSLQVAVLNRRHRLTGNSTWATILWARRQGFDRIYDLQGNRTSRLVVRYSGASRKIGTQPHKVYTAHPSQPYTRSTKQNVFDRLNETLAADGIAPAAPGPPLYLSDRDRQAVVEWKRAAGLEGGSYALLHAGGSGEWTSKRWPARYYSSLATLIETAGVRCVWIGGPDEKDLNHQLAATAGIDATGSFSPLQLASLAQGALFGVTNDSGPMHILCVAAIPVYSFFGPTDPHRSHGAGQAARVLTAPVPCSPCFKRTCPAPMNHACLVNLGPGTVYARLAADLGLPPEDPRP